MRRQALVVAALLIVSHMGSSSRASENSERNARMNQCIKLLQAEDKSLRNYWRGSCGETALEAELNSSGLLPASSSGIEPEESATLILESDSDSCNGSLGYKPIAETSACGLASKTLKQNLSPSAVIRLQLPGHRCARFIPLLLTNKTDFACNAVQTRIACVDAKYDQGSDTTEIRFSTRRDKTAYWSSVIIRPGDIESRKARISDLVTDPQFALLPVAVSGKNVLGEVLSELDSQKEACMASGRTESYCVTRNIAKSDQFMQEWLRRFRNPRKDSPADKRLADAKSLVAELRSRGIDKQLESWLLFKSVAKNEVGLEIEGGSIRVSDPIYGVSDAVFGSSGLSFGAHQIDIGANSPAEVGIFWEVLSAYLSKHEDSALDTARKMQACVNLPMKLETLRALDITYKASPGMTLGLRSKEGTTEYNNRLIKYLQEQVAKTNALPGLFQKSMLARILYADYENQNGSGGSVQVKAKESESGKNLSNCGDVVKAEDALLDKMMWQTFDGKRTHADYYKRYETVRDIVRSNAPQGGVARCE
ncbi:hypothetical protein ACQR2B_32490 [Bradyrhizobium oligotrophicum]|uniref:hypothetical protein n=1 Tax=Bradyrhizobium TaxID=374 RepID=UPI003EBF4F95